jgi:hypothetical protein
MSLAGLSIDMDSVASHLEGYGFVRSEDDGVAYRIALPRILDLLENAGARCTFFLIVGEAETHPELVREIVSRGHEVASHSLTHSLPFHSLQPDALQLEIADSKQILESVSGAPVLGFRAPSWDLPDGLLGLLVEAGYRYDASQYPSILLPLLRRSIARRSASGRTRTGSSAWKGVFGPTGPHFRPAGSGGVWELPMCTVPWIRVPYYHTLRFVLPGPVFSGIGSMARRRRGPISYQFHAVDFLCVEADGLDPRIGRHPGMDLSLDTKLRLAAAAIGELGDKRDVVPLVEILDLVEPQTDPDQIQLRS